jgi:TPR repeat protein
VAPQQASSLVADAIALEHGEGVAKDVVKAMAIYCDAARLGDAQAQFNLGWIYANGRGVVRDDGIAAQLFQMAANSGHPQAANMLRLVGAPASKVLDCLRENLLPTPLPPPSWMKKTNCWPVHRPKGK